ncbi:MAG: hypothetical protein AAF850_04395 [Pseudomonadota bacterium]
MALRGVSRLLALGVFNILSNAVGVAKKMGAAAMRLSRSLLNISAAASALLVSTVANAQQGAVSNPYGVLSNVDLVTLAPVITELGVPFEVTTLAGRQALRLNVNGAVVALRPRVCRGANGGGCVGLEMMGFYSGVAPLDAANRYNDETPPSKAIVTDGGTVVHRYLIADYGLTRGSFAIDLQVFGSIVTKFGDYIGQGSASTVSFKEYIASGGKSVQNVPPGKPMPGDDMADVLNANMAIKVAEGGSSLADDTFLSSYGHDISISAVNIRDLKVDASFFNEAPGVDKD